MKGNRKEIEALVKNVNPRAKLPRGFAFWSVALQIAWLKQHQKPVCACCTTKLGRSKLRTKRGEAVCCRACQNTLNKADEDLDYAMVYAMKKSQHV